MLFDSWPALVLQPRGRKMEFGSAAAEKIKKQIEDAGGTVELK